MMTAGCMPIVGRELRVAARRSATYWTRFQAALIALAPTGLLMINQHFSLVPQAVMGAQLFRTLSFVALLYAMLTAVHLTSDCLSSEKRDSTLGFLFLTDLKPFDVVMGKLAATALSGLYGLVAILPVLAIPVLCGGVTLGDVFRLAVLLLNTLFFAVSVALLVSAWSWQARTAASMTFLILLVMCALGPTAMIATGTSTTPAAGVGLVSPLGAYWLSAGSSFWAPTPTGPFLFWISIVLTHGLGWLFLALCCRTLPRVWMDRPAEKRRLRWREWCRRMVLGAGATRQAFRTQALEINPIYWLGSREMRVRWYPWIFLASMAVIITFSCLVMNVRGVHYPTLIAVAFCFHLFFKQWFSHVACAAFAADRDKGALELLLSSPLTVRDLVRGHALGLRRQFAGPILFMLAAEFTAWGYALATGSHFGENLLEPACVVVGVLVFLADLWALTWLGWWMGATSKNASRASSNTSLRILLVPCIVLAPVLVLLRLNTGVSPPWLLALALACYLFISVAVDVWFGGWARRKLLTELREVAVERYSHRDASETGWRGLIRLLRAPVKPQGGR